MGRVPLYHWLVAFSVDIESQWRRHMFTTLHTAKTQSLLMRIPSLFSLNRVWRTGRFSWNLARTFLKHWGTKMIFPLWQVWTQQWWKIIQYYYLSLQRPRHPFRDWCLLINTVHCISTYVWYPINLAECQMVIFYFPYRTVFLTKAHLKAVDIFFQILQFITFLLIYDLW